jgi:hypothetical protein
MVFLIYYSWFDLQGILDEFSMSDPQEEKREKMNPE